MSTFFGNKLLFRGLIICSLCKDRRKTADNNICRDNTLLISAIERAMETLPSNSEPQTEKRAGGVERRRSRRYDCEGYVKAWVSDRESPIYGEILNIS
jgi:hypothetical protein